MTPRPPVPPPALRPVWADGLDVVCEFVGNLVGLGLGVVIGVPLARAMAVADAVHGLVVDPPTAVLTGIYDRNLERTSA